MKARKAQTLERERGREKRRRAQEEAAARHVERDNKGKGKATSAPPAPPAPDPSFMANRRRRESAPSPPGDAGGTAVAGDSEPTGFAGLRATVSRFLPRLPDPGPSAPGRWEAARAWVLDIVLGRVEPLRLGSLCFLALVVLQLVRYRRGRRRTGHEGAGRGLLGDWSLGQALAVAARKVVDTAKMGTRVTYL
jgi:hypothetical protein